MLMLNLTHKPVNSEHHAEKLYYPILGERMCIIHVVLLMVCAVLYILVILHTSHIISKLNNIILEITTTIIIINYTRGGTLLADHDGK